MSVPTGSFPVENAFDSLEHTLFKTKCGKCGNSSPECVPCPPSEAFIGAEFTHPVNIKCIRISQLEPGVGNCPEIDLQFSTTNEEGSWTIRDSFLEVGTFALLIPKMPVDGEKISEAQTNLNTMSMFTFVLVLVSAVTVGTTREEIG